MRRSCVFYCMIPCVYSQVCRVSRVSEDLVCRVSEGVVCRVSEGLVCRVSEGLVYSTV